MYKKLLAACAFALALAAGASAAQAGVQITVTPTLAPNAYGSPSYATWQTNAVQSLYHGQTSGGASGPAQYNAQSNVTAQEGVVSQFNSWKGQLNPGTTVGPAYSQELGNRMTFGVSVVGSDGSEFSASQLSFFANSNDADDSLGFSWDPGSYTYGNGYLGVLYGADHALGGGDDTFITSGANTQMVDALFGSGSGNSFAAYCSGVCDAADQAAALAAAAYTPGLTQFTGTYQLVDGSGPTSRSPVIAGSGTFNISGAGAVPEPATWAMLILGFGGIGATVRRKRQTMVPTAA